VDRLRRQVLPGVIEVTSDGNENHDEDRKHREDKVTDRPVINRLEDITKAEFKPSAGDIDSIDARAPSKVADYTTISWHEWKLISICFEDASGQS
jgi:hypothetical protein